MATSKPADEIEIVATDVSQHQSQILLDPTTKSSAEQGLKERQPELSTDSDITKVSHLVGAPESVPAVVHSTESSVTTSEPGSTICAPVEIAPILPSEHDSPREPRPASNVPTQEDTISYQSPPLEITGDSSAVAIIFPSVVGAGTSKQSSRKGLLKDVFLECSSAHRFNEDLSLSVMMNGSSETLNITKVSPTKWKITENIIFHHNAGDMTLVVHSEDEGDVAFLTFSEDELYAMGCAEEDTTAEHVFATEDNSVSVKMTFAVTSSSTFGASTINAARGSATQPASKSELLKHAMERALAYKRRFEETGNIDDISQAIFHFEIAVPLFPPADHILPYIFNKIGTLYSTRFSHTKDLQDIDHAICHFESYIESTPPGHPFLPHGYKDLGTAYELRFESTLDLKDIDYAIAHLKSALNTSSRSDPDLPSVFNRLGGSYRRRFSQTNDLQDIDCAIFYQQSAVKSTPSGNAKFPAWSSNLGISYSRRFQCSGKIQDLDEAISHLERAINSTKSSNHDLLVPHALNNVRYSYLDRLPLNTSNHQHIGHFLSLQQRGIGPTPSDSHVELAFWLSLLGTSYKQRFEHTGDLQDNNHAIFYLQRAIESTPSGSKNPASRFNDLGGSYSGRFEHTGDLQDIDHAISYLQRAVESMPSGHADLPGLLSNLGNSYSLRFARTRDLKDIDFAISHHENAVKSTPGGDPSLPTLLGNLSASHLYRFDRTRNFRDIDVAISCLQSAVESAPSGHADLPILLNNLRSSYRDRFKYTGDLQDIDLAIAHHKSALESTPPGHVNLPKCLIHLGLSYAERFKSSRDLANIDCAISYQQGAVKSTPPGNANLSSIFGNLGRSYELRFQLTHHFPDVQNCIASFRRAAEANGPPFIRLETAAFAAELSREHGDSRCLIDFALTIRLLSEVAGLEQTIHRRLAQLRSFSPIVATAVATALHCNEHDLALEWLEQGRCLVWNQFNQLRTPIDKLHMSNPSLANRFVKAAIALESDGTRSVLQIHSFRATLAEEIQIQDDTRDHTLHAADYSQLLREIRGLPDFHDFLQPPKAINLLSSLPSEGPVVIFNLDDTRCDALALMSGITDPLHIPLENFSLPQAKRLQQSLQSNLLKQREAVDEDRSTFFLPMNAQFSMSLILKELWIKVAQPILRALGYQLESCPDPSKRSRIWWCPTGNLSFLPIHAAGIYSATYQAGQCVSDFVVSSYTPSVHSLNEKFKVSPTSSNDTGLLLISQPNTPGLSSITWTRKETRDLKALMDGSGVTTLLLEDAGATIDKVKTEMNANNWVHFACHGIQDANDPLKSGVHLHDGRLELLEIMRQQILNPDLAFLSACQTSKGDLDLSEEVVHLAAGMLAVGYRGVVGTMWSISDMHGPEFATEFYQYLLNKKGESKGLDSTQAAYALDHATRKVRESLGQSEAAFLTWVPYMHFGY